MGNASPVLSGCIDELRRTKRMAEAAMAQLDDAAVHARINPQQNSVAVIIQHLAGNMISRWTNFLTTDGEKPDRNREGEFGDRTLSRADLLGLWERGWATMFQTLAGLSDADLHRTVRVRNEPLTVLEAVLRQMAHYSLHLGQILVIGKHLLGERWKYLTPPPGGSASLKARPGAQVRR